MKISELIAYLECYDEDTEVVIAHQRSWPLELSILGIADAPLADNEENREKVYLVADGADKYAPREVFETFEV